MLFFFISQSPAFYYSCGSIAFQCIVLKYFALFSIQFSFKFDVLKSFGFKQIAFNKIDPNLIWNLQIFSNFICKTQMHTDRNRMIQRKLRRVFKLFGENTYEMRYISFLVLREFPVKKTTSYTIRNVFKCERQLNTVSSYLKIPFKTNRSICRRIVHAHKFQKPEPNRRISYF